MKHALRIPNAFAIPGVRHGQSRPWGVVTPLDAQPVESFSAGWLSRMSKALPKGGSALCCAQGYERPAHRPGLPPLSYEEAAWKPTRWNAWQLL